MRDIKRIIIHCSATKDTSTVSWDSIQHFHTATRGWRDIGYHAGCELSVVGYVCLYGRPVTVSGAHARGNNRDSLGFCFVGNYNDRTPSKTMLRVAARRVLVPWMIQFDLGVDDLHAHNEYANKTCPGTLFDMDLLRRIVAEELEKQKE